MFCSKCGKEVADGVKFCPYCGSELIGSSFQEKASHAFDTADKELENAFDEFANVNSNGEKLKEDRGLFSYIILSIITCGIYSYYFVYKLAHDVNIACKGDGEKTGGLARYIILSIVTCGFYSLYWEYALANRLASNAPKYGMNFQENGTSVLLWSIFGTLICGIGPFIAMNILIKNTNKICAAYNRQH